jgi:hypothetical protein
VRAMAPAVRRPLCNKRHIAGPLTD